MSGSDRGERNQAGLIGAVLVAIVAVAAYWAMFYDMGFQSGQNERKANVESQHYASDAADQIERKCGAKAGQPARECIAEIVAAERESQRNESDLAAQWKAADWVMWAGVLAGAQLLATAFGLYFVKRTLDATLEAVEDTGKATRAMERQNEIAANAQRPWLDFDVEIVKAVDFAENTLHITVTALNHSSFPAHDVRAAAHGHFHGVGVLSAFQNVESHQSKVDAFLGRIGQGGTVFPRERFECQTIVRLDDPHGVVATTELPPAKILVGLSYRFEGGAGLTTKEYGIFGATHIIDNVNNPPKPDALGQTTAFKPLVQCVPASVRAT